MGDAFPKSGAKATPSQSITMIFKVKVHPTTKAPRKHGAFVVGWVLSINEKTWDYNQPRITRIYTNF